MDFESSSKKKSLGSIRKTIKKEKKILLGIYHRHSIVVRTHFACANQMMISGSHTLDKTLQIAICINW